jgi:hypothetical protein
MYYFDSGTSQVNEADPALAQSSKEWTVDFSNKGPKHLADALLDIKSVREFHPEQKETRR